ncbi:MAG: porin [Rhodobacteraceae bacterium]|nr:porin [Paracoccaceae bacterium]
MPHTLPPAASLAALLALALPAGAESPHSAPGLSITGDARMGVVWDRGDSLGPAETGLRLTSRARLRFRFVGETDGGLQFGAEFRLDEATRRPAGGSVSIGGPSSGRLTLGN